MNIQVLGTGCAKCKSLEKAVREVVQQNGIEATITKVEDIVEIMGYGVMTTPALVVNGKVEIKGRVPSSDEIKKLLNKNINGLEIKDSVSLAECWLNEARVAVVPGLAFGDDNYVRFSYATSLEKIQTGLARIEELVNKYY